jgi:hypothetical protein
MWNDELIHGRLARPKRRTIERETPIVPHAVAEGVWQEACVWLGVDLPREWVRRLAVRANVIYRNNSRFQRRIRGIGNHGRDWLWMFTRHWLTAMIYHRDRELYRRLPAEYAAGEDLPQPALTKG